MRGERPCERDPGLRGFEGKTEPGEQLQGRLEVRPRLLVAPSGSDRAPDELGDGARPVVVAVACKNGQLVKRLFRGGEVAACELHLDEQGEHGRAIRIGRRRALEAQAAEVPCQSEVAARQRDPRQRALGARVPVDAFEQTFGLLESSLPNAQVREPKQREELGRPVARLEDPDRGQQLALRLFPAAERDQNPAVVRPAGRRHEVAPRFEASRGGEPLLGTSDVGRPFAGAQQPAVDLAGRADTDDLSRGDRGHRLVEQPHPFGDAPRGDVRLAEQRHRIELEVPIAVAPGDRDRCRRELLAL